MLNVAYQTWDFDKCFGRIVKVSWLPGCCSLETSPRSQEPDEPPPSHRDERPRPGFKTLVTNF